MKYFFLITLLIISISNAAAQVDTGNSIAIPRGNTPAAPPETAPPASTPNPFTPKKETPLLIGNKPKEFSMVPEDKFVNRSSEYMDRVTIRQRGESNEAYRGNQFFGEYKSKSETVNILCRDFAFADGDRIKISVNDQVVISDIMLTNDFNGVVLTLVPGFNKIDFEALNQGTSGPNTAEFRVFDDKDKLISSNEWNLATGFKASVIVIKE